MEEIRTVRPGVPGKSVIGEHGEVLFPPKEWALLPPGDAGLTRKVKLMGPYWLVQSKRGRRTFSGGVWTLATNIESAKAEIEAKRGTVEYQKKQESAKKRRDKKEGEYREDFFGAILAYLRFAERYEEEAKIIAQLVTEHATPVGSGTVARTTRIPVEKRAEAAVIAWMRHKTTAYDTMHIARIKGERRSVRQKLATESVKILRHYRFGKPVESSCPLRKALDKVGS